MIFETIKSEGLAHLSYVLGDEQSGVCAVIDPRRDVDIYIEWARAKKVRVTHVVETHIHADFVSGSRELSARTGAPVHVGTEGDYGFETRPLRDGEAIEVGPFNLRIVHTPGHTPEHICLVAGGGQRTDAPWAVFTGDTLFAGEVGRPDLLGGGTEKPLARKLFHSLREKLLSLEDGVEVYPAHGKGSPCGGSIGEREQTTIGYERRHSEKLGIGDEDTFVQRVMAGLPPAPSYYPRMKRVNREGPRVLGCLPEIEPLSAEAFWEKMGEEGALVLDLREITDFGGAHMAGALNLALRDSHLALWAGWMVEPGQIILLVLPGGDSLERVQRHLLRVGLENVGGYLVPGMTGWIESGLPFERMPQMSVHELREHAAAEKNGLQILDVRRDDEWEKGHVPGAVHIYLPDLAEHAGELDRGRPVATYCGSGYRASIAASLLKRQGFGKVYNVPGSMSAWKAAGFPLEGE